MPVQYDQFYTNPDIAKHCIELLQKHEVGTGMWIEPSAGSGSFLQHVPSAIGYDIDPKIDTILRADFLTVVLPENCVIFGNPPFGRQASLAKRFIRHASSSASVIAFILPLSFTKPSMQRAFPRNFHLVENWILPKNSFLVDDKPHHVPCVFQIWIRKDTERSPDIRMVPVGFTFVKNTQSHDIVFRRVGGNAGRCSLPNETHNKQCHYYIKLSDPSQVEKLIQASESYAFPTNTTGPRSLSKNEAIEFLHHTLQTP